MNPSPELTDGQVAVLVQGGDKEKFGILMERYEKKLLRYGKKFLSERDNIEDVVQEVFIKTYQSIQSFDTTQPFSPWVYRIAHNTFLNYIKKRQRGPLYMFDFDTLVAHPIYEEPERRHDEKDMKEMVEKGLEKLTPAYKEILILYYLEELSYKEIAEILRIPIGTVGIRIKRAKESLRKVYDDLGLGYEKE